MDHQAALSNQQGDEGLWEELHDQHTREMEQHRALHHRQYQHASPHPYMQETTADVTHGFSVFYQAAVEAWREQKARSRDYNPLSNSVDLQEFGIPRSGDEPVEDDPTMMQYTHFPETTAKNNTTDFVYLPQLRFRPPSEGWGAVANLDMYFQSLYHYFYHRGLTPIIGKGVVELITLAFTLVLSVFLLAYVDWHGLASCKGETTCRAQFSDYILARPRGKWLVVCYSVVFLVYTVFSILSFVRTLQDALKAKWVFEERLGISSNKLLGGAVDWDQDVVVKLSELQASGAYRVAIHGQNLDALVISQRIMRKENFLVALFNRNLLDLSVPGISGPLFCPSLEWSLYFCILNFMFNHKHQIRPAFYLDPDALRRRLFLCGVAHLVFMPFLLFFVTLYFGLSNAYDWKNTKQYLGPKDWSLFAKWTFREFNELPHFFERRLGPSYEAAEKYQDLFGSSEIFASVGRLCVFLGGSLGALLFAMAAMNDAILLHVKIADWNLLWYAGLVSALYSGGKALTPTRMQQPSSARNIYDEMDQSLLKVADHTHYYPDIWRKRGWDEATFQTFSNMFQFKAKNFAREVLALVCAPYILCFSLAGCTESICEFVLAIRAQVPGVGDVCGYSTFNFDLYQEEFNSPLQVAEPLAGSLTESVLRHKSVQDAVQAFPKPRTKHGKMEKSFRTFKQNHTSWQISTGQLEKLQTERLDTEQELHRDVVARQLRTLAALEERAPERRPNFPLQTSYLPSTAPADAGAGALAQSQEGSSMPEII